MPRKKSPPQDDPRFTAKLRVFLTPDQHRRIRLVAAHENSSHSAVVRDAIDWGDINKRYSHLFRQEKAA